jgi:hypothetical protein
VFIKIIDQQPPVPLPNDVTTFLLGSLAKVLEWPKQDVRQDHQPDANLRIYVSERFTILKARRRRCGHSLLREHKSSLAK